MSERGLRERLIETISNNNENTIVIIWCSESEADKRQEAITTEYLEFARKCSNERKIKEIGIPDNMMFYTRPPTVAISIGVTIEALKNSETFFEEILQFCEKHKLSYIQIL